MIRSITVSFLLFAILFVVPGCKGPSDRMITSEGQAVCGELESISGRSVVFKSSNVTVDRDDARIFLRDNAGTYRGPVSYIDGVFSIITDSGERSFPVSDVQTIIWSESNSETSIRIDVPAVDGWVRTGMHVNDGDILSLSATGIVTLETGNCGPSGIELFATATALMPGATNGQLIMKVSESEPVAAGSAWTGNSPGTGELMLAVNIPDRESTSGCGGIYYVTVLKTAGVDSGNSVIYLAKR
ncbi:MAG: hypothetical protein K8R76_03845 [Candidatus Aegiribacteria sp.]|nr:hypothetical protein [Candidatus Aegiribacteria sp.]